MGTINYATSKFITLAIQPYDFFETEKYLKENAGYYDIDPESIDDNFVYEEMSRYYEADYENAKYIIDKFDFNILDVKLLDGYYEGYSLNISFDWNYFDDTSEKREAQKELTQLRKLLIELAGVGFVSCYPFWCTTYRDYNETLKEIDTAIKEARDYFKNFPTYNTLKRSKTA